MSNNNQNNNQNNSRLPGRSPFGSPSSGNNNQNNSKPSPFGSSSRSSASSRFSGFSSRFGREKVSWTVMPLAETSVHISLEGLGDPFHRLLGKPLNKDMSSLANIIKVLQEDEALLAELTSVLDEAWESYDFTGAALLFPWDEDVRKPYTQTINPMIPPPKNEKNDDDDEYEAEEPEQFTLKLQTFRAIDVAFVFNVLARTRSNVVVANTPLALEPAFLKQNFICEDPRIVDIARTTGVIEEGW